MTAIATTETLTFDMDAESLGFDAPESYKALQEIARRLHTANRANVYFRWLLGKQLIEIREGQLWDQPDLWADPQQEPTCWEAWIKEDFRAITGFSKETGHGAMQIARCETLESLGEDGLKRFENLANAILLARIERQEPERAKQLLPAAMEQSVKEFRESASVSPERGVAEIVTHTREQATHVSHILDRLAQAPADALEELQLLIEEEVAPLAGDSPSDIVDFLIAAIREHIIAEKGEPKSFYDRDTF